MRKLFCDCCGRDVTELGLCSFEFLCHLATPHKIGYIDNEGNSVSGRHEAYELCHRCYNQIVIKAVEEFNRLKGGGE